MTTISYEHEGQVHELTYHPKKCCELLKSGTLQPCYTFIRADGLRSKSLSKWLPLIWKEAQAPIDFHTYAGRYVFYAPVEVLPALAAAMQKHEATIKGYIQEDLDASLSYLKEVPGYTAEDIFSGILSGVLNGTVYLSEETEESSDE